MNIIRVRQWSSSHPHLPTWFHRRSGCWAGSPNCCFRATTLRAIYRGLWRWVRWSCSHSRVITSIRSCGLTSGGFWIIRWFKRDWDFHLFCWVICCFSSGTPCFSWVGRHWHRNAPSSPPSAISRKGWLWYCLVYFLRTLDTYRSHTAHSSHSQETIVCRRDCSWLWLSCWWLDCHWHQSLIFFRWCCWWCFCRSSQQRCWSAWWLF